MTTNLHALAHQALPHLLAGTSMQITHVRPVGFPLARWKAVTRGHEVGPDDVAAAVLFFATCPPDITGQFLTVD